METMSVGLAATNLELPPVSLAAWLAGLESHMAHAQAAGAGMLMLPEFACAQWLGFAPPGLPPAEQPAWLASMAQEAAPGLRDLAMRYNMALLAGTVPVYRPGSALALNQAWLFFPDGLQMVQDKLCLTPSEQAGFMPGSQLQVIAWQGLRIAIVICLDVEYTSLWARLGRLNLDLVLIPARTTGASGYTRVMACARARAIELQTVVCVAGATGTPLTHLSLDAGMGGAAAYLPCEASLGVTGIAAELPMQAPGQSASPLLIAADLPLGACRRIRYGAAEAEVWPASWSADHVVINDPVATAA